ncbi:MAG: hypothetical protein J6I62_01090 [Selenomonadaceae bacterium]|nr:hypothetical protein [Selenomonadaceae bacterium]
MTARNDRNIENILWQEFGEDYILGISFFLFNAAKRFEESRGLSDYIYLDENLLRQCLIDVLFDLQRLRHFHDIQQENLIKIHSYVAYWWLRRKPFQRMQNCGHIALFVNELFVEKFLLSALSNDLSDVSKYNQNKMSGASAYLQYHLKYRSPNPQTLELFLVGLDVAK